MQNKKEAVGFLVRYLFPHAHSFRKDIEKCLNDVDTSDVLEDWQGRINEVRNEMHTYMQTYEPPTLAVKIERAKAALAKLEADKTVEVGHPEHFANSYVDIF